MSKGSNNYSGGINALGLLGVAFVVLKLCKVITWSWWWVTAPFWGGLALILAFFIVAMLVCLIGVIVSGLIALRAKKARKKRAGRI